MSTKRQREEPCGTIKLRRSARIRNQQEEQLINQIYNPINVSGIPPDYGSPISQRSEEVDIPQSETDNIDEAVEEEEEYPTSDNDSSATSYVPRYWGYAYGHSGENASGDDDSSLASQDSGSITDPNNIEGDNEPKDKEAKILRRSPRLSEHRK